MLITNRWYTCLDMISRKQTGFGIVEMLLVIVFVLASAGMGMYVLSRQNQQTQIAQESQPELPTPTSPRATNPDEQPLRFAELDVLEDINNAVHINEVSRALVDFFDQYGLDYYAHNIAYSDYVNQYANIKEITVNDLVAYKNLAAILVDEWAKYPQSWIDSSGVVGVSIVKQISVEGQIRAAMPDVDGDVVYYAIDYDLEYMETVIHHEYNHLVEFNIFDVYDRSDPEWTSCHPDSFSYKGGGVLAYDDPEYSEQLHPQTGFVSVYATYAIEEDKAELFSYLMDDELYPQLVEWASTDSCLREKVSEYQDFIDDYSPEMSGNYFERINL